mmetsp:Transcript_21358/g.27287  ORF Transcript_21358/g.27287 Transcript_21358/m.27287 type:complete len:117 (+) Transcript_21358:444-794(+)
MKDLKVIEGQAPFNPYENPPNWITLDISQGNNENEVVVDLSPLHGKTPVAIRYAWGNTIDRCCVKTTQSHVDEVTSICKPEACPIFSSSNNLPANPFMARIINGKCKCLDPQICNE